MPRDQRSPRPPIQQKNRSAVLAPCFRLHRFRCSEQGVSRRGLCSPRRRASRRSDSAALRRGFSRQPPHVQKQPTDRSQPTITRHHLTTPQFFYFRHARLLSPSAPAPGTGLYYHQHLNNRTITTMKRHRPPRLWLPSPRRGGAGGGVSPRRRALWPEARRRGFTSQPFFVKAPPRSSRTTEETSAPDSAPPRCERRHC